MSSTACLTRLGRDFRTLPIFVALYLSLLPAAAQQAEPHDHSQHGAPVDHSRHGMKPSGHTGSAPAPDVGKTTPAKSKPTAKRDRHPASHSAAQHAAPKQQVTHGGHDDGAHDEHGGMKGFLGPYAMTREGSGTSWVPDISPHE